MTLTSLQKRICEQVVNAFETGSANGNYAGLVVYADGPHGIRQITYGRAQTTEYGNLESLLEAYIGRGGAFAARMLPYLPKLGVTPLADDSDFKSALKEAGKSDPVMAKTQDAFFEKHYYAPAQKWAKANGFVKPLSMLVIYDSFIHSGSILDFLRKRFAAAVPINGGNEDSWIRQYVDTRREWLATHQKPILQKTVYRMDCFKREIKRGNWDLATVPINANGIMVTGA